MGCVLFFSCRVAVLPWAFKKFPVNDAALQGEFVVVARCASNFLTREIWPGLCSPLRKMISSREFCLFKYSPCYRGGRGIKSRVIFSAGEFRLINLECCARASSFCEWRRWRSLLCKDPICLRARGKNVLGSFSRFLWYRGERTDLPGESIIRQMCLKRLIGQLTFFFYWLCVYYYYSSSVKHVNSTLRKQDRIVLLVNAES